MRTLNEDLHWNSIFTFDSLLPSFLIISITSKILALFHVHLINSALNR